VVQDGSGGLAWCGHVRLPASVLGGVGRVGASGCSWRGARALAGARSGALARRCSSLVRRVGRPGRGARDWSGAGQGATGLDRVPGRRLPGGACGRSRKERGKREAGGTTCKSEKREKGETFLAAAASREEAGGTRPILAGPLVGF
jgi:hypothetical protein